MLYFILEIIIWIAQCFPEPKAKPISQQSVDLERELENVRAKLHYMAQDVFIEKIMTNGPEQTNGNVVVGDNAGISSTPEAHIEQPMVDVSTQTEDNAISEDELRITPVTELPSQTKGAVDPNIDPNMRSDVERRTDEIDIENRTQPQEHPTTIDASESSERDESRSKGLLAAAQDRGDGAPLEETGSVLQDIGENVAAAEASPMVPEELLKAEENAHQQTRANLARLEDWCKRLEDENAELQTQVEGVGRENAIIQRQLHDAEDESTGFQKRLSDSQHQIHELTSSSEIYISTTEELQNQVAGLNADLSWYSQLGTEFFVRLQNAEKFLRPCDGVFDEYQRLMGDAAHYFTKLGPREPDTDSLGEERFVEVVEEGHNEEQENAPESKGVPMLGKHKVTWDHTLANGGDTMQADTIQVNKMDSTLEDDDAPCPGHPMRPGTKSRPPISVFENGSADTREGSSSSLFENLGQKFEHAPSPAAPAFPISFDFLGPSFNRGEKCETLAVEEPSWKPIHEPAKEPSHNPKASNTSARRRHGRGGTKPGRGRSSRGTNLW